MIVFLVLPVLCAICVLVPLVDFVGEWPSASWWLSRCGLRAREANFLAEYQERARRAHVLRERYCDLAAKKVLCG